MTTQQSELIRTYIPNLMMHNASYLWMEFNIYRGMDGAKEGTIWLPVNKTSKCFQDGLTAELLLSRFNLFRLCGINELAIVSRGCEVLEIERHKQGGERLVVYRFEKVAS